MQIKRLGGYGAILASPVGFSDSQPKPGIPDLTYANLEFKYGRSSLVDAHMATFAATLTACKVLPRNSYTERRCSETLQQFLCQSH